MTQTGNIIKGNLATDVIKSTTESVVNLSKAAISVGTSFETAMSQVAATMGITTSEIQSGSKEYEMLTAKAKEMGSTTKYTATEAAEGLNILAMSGLSAEEACSGISSVMYLAGAGAMSLSDSASYTTGTVKGFNDTMANASKYTDIMAKGATLANTDVKELGTALSTVSATANAYNQSVESTSVALLRLAEQNVTGAEAATSLSRVMADLYTPTTKAKDAMEKLGVSVYDSQGNARDLNDVVDELNEALNGMSTEEKLAYENTIFTTYGMKGFQKMTVSTTETVDKFKQGIAEASGSAMQQFETQNDNLTGKLAILQSALEGLALKVYEIFSDDLKNSVEDFTNIIDKISESVENGDLGDSLERLSEAFSDFMETATKLGGTILPVLIDALTLVIDNAGILTTALVGYKTATLAAEIATGKLTVALASNPIGLIAVSAAAAAVAVKALIEPVRGISDEVKELAEGSHKAQEATNKLVNSARDMSSTFSAERELVSALTSKLKENQQALKDNAEAGTTDNELISETKEIVTQLNTAIDGLNLEIDEETGLLKDGTDAWDEYVEAQMKQSQASAVLEKINSLEEQKLDNDIEIIKLTKQLTEEEQKLIEKDISYYEGLANKVDLTEEEAAELEAYRQVMINATEDEKAMIQQVQFLRDSTADLNEEEEILKDYVSENSEKMTELGDATEETANSTEGLKTQSEELVETLQEEKDTLEETLNSQISLFSDYTKATKVSKEEMLSNLEEQITAMEEWATNMQILSARGISEGLLKELSEMGPKSAGYVQGLLDMTGPEMEKLNEMYVSGFRITESTSSMLVSEYNNLGTTIAQEFVNGEWVEVQNNNQDKIANQMVTDLMNSSEWDRLSTEAKDKILNASSGMLEAAESDTNLKESVPNAMVQALMESSTWNSLSEQAKQKILDASSSMEEEAGTVKESTGKVGESAISGLTGKMEEGKAEVKTAAEGISDEITETLEDEFGINNGGSSKTLEYGQSISNSLGEGIKSNSSIATNNATTLAMQVKTAVQNGLPKSTFDAIGQNVASGVASGISSATGQATTSASTMATSVKTTVDTGLPKSAFSEIGKNIASGIAEGIESGKSEAINAATKLAEETISAAKTKLQINSPSKVFEEIGAYCVTGFSQGLDTMSVESSIGRNIDNTLSNMMANTSEGGGGITQNITINSRAMSPDEIAREIRLETKYDLMGGVTVE